MSSIEKALDATETNYKEKKYEIYHRNFEKALAIGAFLLFCVLAVIVHIAESKKGEDCDIYAVCTFYCFSFISLLVAIHYYNYTVICYKETFKVRKLFVYRTYEYKDTTIKEGSIYTRIYCKKRQVTKLRYAFVNYNNFERVLKKYSKKHGKYEKI